jgi:hypothetical protein
VLLGLPLLAVGCAPRQDPSEYEDRLDKALTVRNTAVEQLDGSKLQDEAQYRTLRDQVQGALDELDSEPPPKDYSKGHELMVDGLDGLAVLLGKLGRCEALNKSSLQDARACRQSIGQDVFDTLRNNFAESDAIYRQEGLSLPALGGDEDDQTDTGGGGDVLSGS